MLSGHSGNSQVWTQGSHEDFNMCLMNNLISVLQEIHHHQESLSPDKFLKVENDPKFEVNTYIISILFPLINDGIHIKKCRRKLKKIKQHFFVVLFSSHGVSGILTKNYYDLNLLNTMYLSTASLRLSWYEHHRHKSTLLRYFSVFVWYLWIQKSF